MNSAFNLRTQIRDLELTEYNLLFQLTNKIVFKFVEESATDGDDLIDLSRQTIHLGVEIGHAIVSFFKKDSIKLMET